MIEIRHLSKTYRTGQEQVTPFHDLSLEVAAGEFVAVFGPSGCGKTTLLLIVGGMLRPTSGAVKVDDRDMYAMSDEDRARFRARNVGYVFQQFHLIPYLNVVENVLAAAIPLGNRGSRERAEQLLERFGLQHRLRHYPSELSTGERQRTALARALYNDPKVLLADEPTGNLDKESGATVLEALADFAKHGGSVLLATHDARAAEYADRTIELT